MSFTYHLFCRTCRVYAWIGQGWPLSVTGTEDRRYIYGGDLFGRFLYAHETSADQNGEVATEHALFFCSSESLLTDDFAEMIDDGSIKKDE